MKLYLLHLPEGIAPGSTEAAGKLVSVKDGFSWGAFILTLPWLLWNRLWLWSAVFVLANMLIELAARLLGSNETVLMFCYLFLSLFIALEAGMLRSRGLQKRGYRHIATFVARDCE
ncbi:MAG: DUF2628 domain-containing protein, partial [Pseudomonadota bacterium]